MGRTLTVHAPAKINLTLRVGLRRPDGYHDVRTVLQALALRDTLTFRERRGPFALACRTPGVPADRTNLVWRAADRLWRALGRPGEPRDVHVKLEKRIPAAAGLGGGSADAAAAIVGLHRFWGGRLSGRDLANVAAELGADVPFFLIGGTALGAGRGDELYPLDDSKRLGVVIITPAFGVATADAYRWLDEDRARTTGTAPAARPLDLGWATGPVDLANDLLPPVMRRHPEIAEMLEACGQAGCLGASMTGSGSAVFGVFSVVAAVRAARRLRRPAWLVHATRTLTRRESARLLGAGPVLHS